MRQLLLSVLLCLTLGIYSCTIPFGAYLRNMTNETAVIDVFLLDKTGMATLPNKIKVANKIINFKSGFQKFIDSSQNVTWVDISHFKLEMKPNTTVDLTDMAGRFVNSYPLEEVRIIVSTNDKVDTLMNGRFYFNHDKFEYKNVGISSPLLYYDIK